MKNILAPCILTVLLLSTTIFAFAQGGWNSVPSSAKFSIGYKSFELTDEKRFAINGTGELLNDHATFEIFMWYPAVVEKKSKRMTFQNYTTYSTGANQPAATSLFKRMAKLALDAELSDGQVNEIFLSETRSVMNAKMRSGTFPVVIVLQQDGAVQSSVLCEYLAGRGFVVITSELTARQEKLMMSGWLKSQHHQVVNDRIADLEFLVNFVVQQKFSDVHKLGVLAINSEGIPALLFQMKNMAKLPVVTIDGWESGQQSAQVITSSVYFAPERMRSPWLALISDRDFIRTLEQPSLVTFDSLSFSTRYLFSMEGLNHFFYMGNMGVLKNLPDHQRTAFNYISCLIGNFFDATLNTSEEAITFMNNKATVNQVPSEFVGMEIRKSP